MEIIERNMETEVDKCKITARELCLDMNCKNCNSRRFYFHRFARFYSTKNEQNILKVTRKTESNIILDCKECNKEVINQVCTLVKRSDNSSFCDDCNKRLLFERNSLKKVVKEQKKCGPRSQTFCNDKDCKFCPPRKLSSHHFSKYYSPSNKEKIDNISLSSHKECLFICPYCKDEHKYKIYEITNMTEEEGFCKECKKKKKMELTRTIESGCKPTSVVLCNNDECKYCPLRKFSKHRFAQYYSDKNKKDINQIMIKSGLSYLFNCPDCNKELTLSISKISKYTEEKKICEDCELKDMIQRREEKKKKKLEEELSKECNPRSQYLCTDLNCEVCEPKRFMNHPFSKYYNIVLNDEDILTLHKGSSKYYWFKCDICKHNSHQSLSNITREGCKEFCRYCSNELLCGVKECKHCWERSFASHEKSKYWSDKNEKNPWDVHKGITRIKYLLNCEKCTHEYWGRLSHITNPNEQCGCPYCHTEALCKDINCQICFKLSFASYEKSKCWSIKNIDKPHEIRKGSAQFYLFECDKCFHEFEMQPAKVTNEKLNHWCPYCSNTYLCEKEDCKHCFNRSFASMFESKYWSPTNNGLLTPRKVFKRSSKLIVLECNDCNIDYTIRPADIYFRSGSCPTCYLKTEKKVLLYVNDNIEHVIKRNIKFKWCINPNTNRYLPFDLVVEDLKLIIEVDGDQHFKYVSLFDNDIERNQNRDLFKMKMALENGYSIIRIVQRAIFYNLFDWKPLLISAIKKYDKPQVIFIDYKGEYEVYKEKMKTIDTVSLDCELDECEEVLDEE